MAKKRFTATIYGIWPPNPEDSIYYYTGETVEIEGDTLVEIVAANHNALISEGTLKATARVLDNGELVHLLNERGLDALDFDWQTNPEKAKSNALANARLAGATEKTMEAISRGNVHEIEFYNDPRTWAWTVLARQQPKQLSLFDEKEG